MVLHCVMKLTQLFARTFLEATRFQDIYNQYNTVTCSCTCHLLVSTITLLKLTEAPINPNQLTRKYEMALKIQHLLACKEFDYPLYSRHIQHLVRSYVAIAMYLYTCI